MDRSANIYSRFFLHIGDCKILNQRKLYDSAILCGLQNIVKEGLTATEHGVLVQPDLEKRSRRVSD